AGAVGCAGAGGLVSAGFLLARPASVDGLEPGVPYPEASVVGQVEIDRPGNAQRPLGPVKPSDPFRDEYELGSGPTLLVGARAPMRDMLGRGKEIPFPPIATPMSHDQVCEPIVRMPRPENEVIHLRSKGIPAAQLIGTVEATVVL